MKGFITLTRHGYSDADLRLNVRHIVYYHPAEVAGGTAIVTSEPAEGGGGCSWYVAESCSEIDALIGGAS